MDQVKIIYILSHGHSGSTVLGSALGNHRSAFHAGEFANFVKVVNGELETCSCKHLPRECLFWSPVITRFEKELSQSGITLADFERMREDIETNIFKKKVKDPEFTLLKDLTVKLFRIIAEESGKNIIVDSSKSANRAVVLSKIFGDNLSVIYLMRDYKGVLKSFKRKKKDLKSFDFLKSLYREHLKIGYAIRSSKLNSVPFFYDNLFIQDKIDGLFDKLKIEGSVDLSGQFTNHHVIAGNRMRYKDNFFLEKTENNLIDLSLTESMLAKSFNSARKLF